VAPLTTRPMATSESFEAFDVVIVPFPSVDRLAEKRRPALVISSAALATFGVLWVAMITSAANDAWTCDVPLADLERAGLPAPSVVRPAKIACIEPGRVVRRAGTLDSRTASLVTARLGRFLAKRRAPTR
jgi:mRNA interferase MazF